MGIMLAGVEYPEIDLNVKVPEKLETAKINNDIINVPKIPGNKINDEKIEINPEISNQKNYETTTWNNLISLETQKIDSSVNIPTITNNNYIDTSLKLGDLSEYFKKLSGDAFDARYKYTEMVLNNMPRVESLIPTFSEDYKRALVKFQEPYFRDKHKGYLDDFLQIYETQKYKFGKRLYSLQKNAKLLENSNIFSDGADNNSNLYGAIPQGYLYSSFYGDLRWEGINFNRLDPILASFGIIKFSSDGILLSEKGIKPPINPESPDETYYGKILRNLRFGDKDIRNILLKWDTDTTNGRTWSFVKPDKMSYINITEGEAKDPNKMKTYYEKHFDKTKIPNRSVYFMLSSGADFIQNMFDVALVINNNSDLQFSEFLETVGSNTISSDITINKLFLTDTVLQVRTSSIEVPQMINDTFQVKYFGHTITKVRSKINYERKSSLKILLDEPLYMRLFFNILSGNSRRINDVNGNISPNNSYTHRPPHYYPGNLNNMISNKIDILIKHEALLNYPVLSTMKNTLRGIEESQGYAENSPAEYPIWWFQNVKFLGDGTELQFDRDGNSITELSFPFLFSRCIKIDRSAKTAVNDIFSNVDGNNMVTDTDFMKKITAYQGDQEYLQNHPFWK